MRWFTVHQALRQHRKWLGLDDHAKAAWLSLMLIGSTGTPRWSVGDRATAVELLHREGVRNPAKALEALIAAGLVDEADAGLWMHDAESWQRKPSDAPEATAERKRRSRESGGSGGSDPPVTPRHALSRPVTPIDRQIDTQTVAHRRARGPESPIPIRRQPADTNEEGLWHRGQHPDCLTCREYNQRKARNQK